MNYHTPCVLSNKKTEHDYRIFLSNFNPNKERKCSDTKKTEHQIIAVRVKITADEETKTIFRLMIKCKRV